jgi:hypothetical protein
VITSSLISPGFGGEDAVALSLLTSVLLILTSVNRDEEEPIRLAAGQLAIEIAFAIG